MTTDHVGLQVEHAGGIWVVTATWGTFAVTHSGPTHRAAVAVTLDTLAKMIMTDGSPPKGDAPHNPDYDPGGSY